MNLLSMVAQGKKTETIPVWFMRQAGRYMPSYRKIRSEFENFFDLCYNHEAAVTVTMQPVEQFDLDAAIVFSDIMIVLDIMDVKVNFQENVGPVIDFKPDKKSVDDLSKRFAHDKSEIIKQIVRSCRKHLKPDKALIGFAGGPWTLATYLIEGGSSKKFDKVKKFMYQERELFDKIIYILTGIVTGHMLTQAEAGADILQLFDSWAGILSEEEFYRYVTVPTTKIIDEIRKATDKPVIAFPNHAGTNIGSFTKHAKPSILSVDYYSNLDDIMKLTYTPLQGNLNPYVLAYDKKQALIETDKILKFAANRPFVFNTGHGIIPDTPEQNVAAVVDRVRSFSR